MCPIVLHCGSFCCVQDWLVGSYRWYGFGFASLAVNTLESVPSSSRFGLNDVLFFLTILNSLSSSVFEWGRTSTSFTTFPSMGNVGLPSGGHWAQVCPILSILRYCALFFSYPWPEMFSKHLQEFHYFPSAGNPDILVNCVESPMATVPDTWQLLKIQSSVSTHSFTQYSIQYVATKKNSTCEKSPSSLLSKSTNWEFCVTGSS